MIFFKQLQLWFQDVPRLSYSFIIFVLFASKPAFSSMCTKPFYCGKGLSLLRCFPNLWGTLTFRNFDDRTPKCCAQIKCVVSEVWSSMFVSFYCRSSLSLLARHLYHHLSPDAFAASAMPHVHTWKVPPEHNSVSCRLSLFAFYSSLWLLLLLPPLSSLGCSLFSCLSSSCCLSIWLSLSCIHSNRALHSPPSGITCWH